MAPNIAEHGWQVWRAAVSVVLTAAGVRRCEELRRMREYSQYSAQPGACRAAAV